MQLGQRQRDGRPLREHLLGAQAKEGFTHPLLVDEALPPGGQLLWDLLNDLNDTRRHGMSQAGGILPSEIEAWQRLHGVQLTSWEIDTLHAMDRAARATVADMKPKPKAPAAGATSKRLDA